ncbi:hypothetical protein [Mammaliicoccus sp. P-M59]|uniref:hypothetical protein n=1 Tax=Mammaliicoccus sp. P-M59 TaxID=2898718 RepID=UPI001EFA735A|nr:hypothetical protein [Mammaliicoccus sp. P-M59]
MALFNLTIEEIQQLSFFDLQRKLKWAITDYNKTFNRPLEVRPVIYDTKDSGDIMAMSDEFANDVKHLTRWHMKQAINNMKAEYKMRLRNDGNYPKEHMEMLFKSLEENNQKLFDLEAE